MTVWEGVSYHVCDEVEVGGTVDFRNDKCVDVRGFQLEARYQQAVTTWQSRERRTTSDRSSRA